MLLLFVITESNLIFWGLLTTRLLRLCRLDCGGTLLAATAAIGCLIDEAKSNSSSSILILAYISTLAFPARIGIL